MKLIAVLFIVTLIKCSSSVTVYRKWNLIDVKFPDLNIRRKAISDGTFVPENIIPIDIDVDYKGL
jgi:hypothetical protein